jgi:hypothetical protein
LNEDKNRLMAEVSTKYETEMKELEIASLSKDKELLIKDKKLSEADLNRHRILIYSVIAVLLLVTVLAFFIYKSYQQNKLANIKLQGKNKQIEEKNKSITDSINYARRIQNSLITSEKYIQKNLERLKGRS